MPPAKPLTRWVGEQEVLPFQAFLKSFYSVVKATESKQRFCLMTGVSKFSKVSIFSDLNNLTDITMDPRASALLGYTHEEVRANFPARLAALAEQMGSDIDGACARLARAYMRPGTDVSKTSGWAFACCRAVAEGDVAEFISTLESFFSSIGYDLSDRLSEQAYQHIVVAILRFVGIYLDAEVTTSRGRADLVMRAPGHVFVVEMKVASGEEAGERAAAAALAQIRERGYADPFRCLDDKVALLGIAFNCETHNIGAWTSELL